MRVSGAPCSWWARKQPAAFSTTKEKVVDCRFAVAVPCYSHYPIEMVTSPINTPEAASEETGWTPACTVLEFLPVVLYCHIYRYGYR